MHRLHLFNYFNKLYICFRKPLTLLVGLFSLEQNQYFCTKRKRRATSVGVNYVSGGRHILYKVRH